MRSSRCVVVCVVALAGCAPHGHAPREQPARSPNVSGADYVLRGADFTGNVLETLRHRVQNASVIYSSTGACPRISLRGARASGNPSVYIDGTLVDSCALSNLTAQDIDRAEIYRSGAATHAGVRSNPNGLILVYRVRS